jgi:hypothetical protein
MQNNHNKWYFIFIVNYKKNIWFWLFSSHITTATFPVFFFFSIVKHGCPPNPSRHIVPAVAAGRGCAIRHREG